MRTLKLMNARGTGGALAVVLALAGCAGEPETKVVTITPPVIAVAPAAVAPTFRTRIGVAPLPGDREIRLQSFAGDVCVADDRGGGFVSHCICAGSECTCQGAAGSCTP